jgi:putative heme-binding domain-containing protein
MDTLIAGMEAGLQGNRIDSIPAALREQAAAVWNTRPHAPALVSFALRLDHPPAAAAAVAMLGDAKTTLAERKGLLQLLAERRVETAAPVIVQLFASEKNEQARLDLLNALAHFDSAAVGQCLLEALPGLTPRLRAAAVTALASRAPWARALLDLVGRGIVKKEHILPGDLLVIQKLGDPEADALLKKNWGSLRASSAEKEALIKNLRFVLGRSGNAENGHAIFRTTCAVCHTLKGEGAKIGPDLTGYERDNLDFMLPAIVDPSLGIREEYVVFTLTKKDGQVLAGFVTETTPQFVTIKDPAGNLTKTPREEIQSLTASPISLMPEGLLNALTTEQTRDLFTYLKSK